MREGSSLTETCLTQERLGLFTWHEWLQATWKHQMVSVEVGINSTDYLIIFSIIEFATESSIESLLWQGYGHPAGPGMGGARPGFPNQVPPASSQHQMLQQAQAQAQARAQAAMAGQNPSNFPRPAPGQTNPALMRPALGQNPAGPLAPLKAGWTEHNAPDGRKYYYNAATKVSSWVRPVEAVPQVLFWQLL